MNVGPVGLPSGTHYPGYRAVAPASVDEIASFAMRPPARYPWGEAEASDLIRAAVRQYWISRAGQSEKQHSAGAADAGKRGEVTGGKHLDGFLRILESVILASGLKQEEIRHNSGVEIPGYYRPTKKWDVVVVRNGRLCAAVEMKSQAGPASATTLITGRKKPSDQLQTSGSRIGRGQLGPSFLGLDTSFSLKRRIPPQGQYGSPRQFLNRYLSLGGHPTCSVTAFSANA